MGTGKGKGPATVQAMGTGTGPMPWVQVQVHNFVAISSGHVYGINMMSCRVINFSQLVFNHYKQFYSSC